MTDSNRGAHLRLRLLAGQTNLPLAETIARRLDVALIRQSIERFPDGELHVTLHDSVRNGDVYLLQPTGPPGDQYLFEMLCVADACRRRSRRAHRSDPVVAGRCSDP
jgi:ribose-phosphate pyrophosphokinase